MKSSVGETTSNASNAPKGFVKSEFRKGYKIDILPYQTHGIISRVLWASKDHEIRIIPGYDPTTGAILPQNIKVDRYSREADPGEYVSDTFYQARVVDRFGSLSAPFICDYAPGSPDALAYGGETVLHNFIRDIMYSCNDRGKSKRIKPINEWYMWCSPGPSARLDYDKTSLLMQALIFKVNGAVNSDFETKQPLVDEEGNVLPLLAVVAINNQGSISNLLRALVEPKDFAKPLDPFTNNNYGPMAELDGIKLFLNTHQDAKNHAELLPSVQVRGDGWTMTPFPIEADCIPSLWHPWDQLLCYMTAEEQVRLCAQEFGADTVNYVLGNNPKMATVPIPDDIRKAGYGRYSAYVGAGGSPAAPSTIADAVSKARGVMTARGLGAGLGRPAVGGMAPYPPAAPGAPMQQQPVGQVATHVDQAALQAEVARIRQAQAGAAAPAPDAQANAASDLLDGQEG